MDQNKISRKSKQQGIQPSHQKDWLKKLEEVSGKPLEFSQKRRSANLDIAFIFDTTGSMYSYLTEVRSQLSRIIGEVNQVTVNSNMAVIAYGDYCDANTTYVTKTLDLTSDFQNVQTFVNQVQATGGGDAPEAVEEALFQANQLNWRPDSNRAVVLIGDAPPHGVVDSLSNSLYGHDYKVETAALSQKNVKIYAVQCGRDSSTEQVFRWLSSQTNGIYLNLENISDLVDLLIGVCMKEVGLLESYTQKLQSDKLMTESKSRLLKQLNPGN